MSVRRSTEPQEARDRPAGGTVPLPVHGGSTAGTQPLGAHRLRCTLLAPLGIRDVFRAFEDARNLARITPPWLDFKVTTNDIAMRAGTEIDYVIKWQGIPMKWKTLITQYEPPHFFADVQLRGPYTLWHHRHDFQETPEGTLVSDCVNYTLPLGPLGKAVHGLVVRQQLLKIFAYRQKTMPELLGVPCKTLLDPVVE